MKQNENKSGCKKIVCSNCNSNNTIKWCRRKTQNRVLIQRYKCKDCNKCFSIDDGFFRMRNAPQKIAQSIDMFYRGISTRGVQQHLAMFYPHNASCVSIYNRVIKYSKMIGRYTDKLKINSSGNLEFDEMEYHRRKNPKSGGVDKNWFIDSIDVETRFMVSSDYAKARSIKSIKKVLLKIKNKAENIRKITTDGLSAYENVVKKTFGYNLKEGKYQIEHKIVTQRKGEGFNHRVERLHSNIRARTKTMRGFHGSINSANAIMKGYEVYYNFIRKHLAINCCPYELAIPGLKDYFGEVKNKWLGLIHLTKEADL